MPAGRRLRFITHNLPLPHWRVTHWRTRLRYSPPPLAQPSSNPHQVFKSGPVKWRVCIVDKQVSPWQVCFSGPLPPVGRIACDFLGPYINNTRLDYVVNDLGGSTDAVNTQHINTRYGFGGTFFGDYTDIAAGSNNVFHAFWTDSNNEQTVVWFYGFQFVPTLIHQQDVVIGSGNF